MRTVPRAALVLAALASALPAHALPAQTRPPDLRQYLFVAEADDIEALWINPAGLGIRPGFALLTQITFQARDGLEDLEYGQQVLGLRLGSFGIGYRHDEFRGAEQVVRAQGDAYALGQALVLRSVAIGAAMTWHRVGPHASGYDVGGLWRPAPWLSLGAAWRDIGSPAVGGVEQEEHVAAGVSLRPFGRGLTASGEAEIRDGDLARWRAGLRLLTPAGLEATVALHLDGDGVEGYALGLRLRGVREAQDLVARWPRGAGDSRYLLATRHSAQANRPPVFVPRRIARVTLGGEYADYRPAGFAILGADERGAQPLVEALRQARHDPAIRGLLLKVRPLSGGFIGSVTALHQEIRAALEAFRAAGKPIIAYLDAESGAAELYLASAADEIVAPRTGVVAVLGVHFELLRLRRTFDRFGIEWDTAYAGAYKPSFHTQATDTSTSAQRAWIDGLVGRAFTELVEGIAAGRKLPADSVRKLIDRPPLTAAAARAAGLVDRIGDEQAAEARLRERLGKKPIRELARLDYREERWGVPPTVVVVTAEGAIASGRSRRDPLFGSRRLGAETVARQLRDAANVPGVRAVVLRIDSPGGSAVASDEILSAVQWLRMEKKIPVVASMGNVAASGGYWIAMRADSIVADPLTVTGSIGVAFAVPVFEELIDTLRVVRESWQRGRHADALSPFQQRSPEQLALLRAAIGETYDLFLREVAEGRGLPADSVLAVAGGRVWFGRDARAAGLVDELGGLERALEIAAARGGIEGAFRVVRISGPRRGLMGQMLQRLGLPLGRESSP